MLKQLDTLIGFSVVMAVVSLLVTIATQIISSFLALRGINLRDALEVMIIKVAPQIDADTRRKLVQDILTHPTISDSILSVGEPFSLSKESNPGWWRRLTNRWRLASAIRPDEMLGLLEERAGVKAHAVQTWLDNFLADISQGSTAALNALNSVASKGREVPTADFASTLQPLANQAISSRKDFNNPANPNDPQLHNKAKQATADFLNVVAPIAPIKFAAIGILATLHDRTPATATALNALEQALPRLAETQGAAVVQEFVAARNITLNNLERWFNSAQDRAGQWFAMHTRIIAIIAATLAAFILQLDTIQIFKDVSSDSSLRDNLVKVALNPAFQAQASNALSGTVTDQVDSRTHQEIVSALLSQNQYKGLPTNLAVLTNYSSAADAEIQLASSLTNNPLVQSFTNDYQQMLSHKRIDALGTNFQNILKSAEQGGLQLLPQPYPDVFGGKWSWPPRHLLGILLSAALLSLGAPFWFNILKSLANLRPMLADAVDKDPKQLPSSTTK